MHTPTIKTKERQRLSFVFMMRYSSSPWLRSNCKFAYPVRRSPSSLGRSRTWVSRSAATLPCHLDQNNIFPYVYDRPRTYKSQNKLQIDRVYINAIKSIDKPLKK